MPLIPIHLTIDSPLSLTPRVLEAAALFGVDVDARRRTTIIPPVEIPVPLETGGVVLITGPSGGGKSSLLRALVSHCRRLDRRVIEIVAAADAPDRPLVDCFDAPLPDAMGWLARAGLGEALVMLRRPRELSDGQQARFALARAMHEAARDDARDGPGAIIAADEFGATLDRLTAHVIARQVRRWIDVSRHTFLAATTHDDLLEPLAPDVLVWKGDGAAIEVAQRDVRSVTPRAQAREQGD